MRSTSPPRRCSTSSTKIVPNSMDELYVKAPIATYADFKKEILKLGLS